MRLSTAPHTHGEVAGIYGSVQTLHPKCDPCMCLIVCAYLQVQLRRLGERIGGDADRFEELARSHISSFLGFLYSYVCVSGRFMPRYQVC